MRDLKKLLEKTVDMSKLYNIVRNFNYLSFKIRVSLFNFSFGILSDKVFHIPDTLLAITSNPDIVLAPSDSYQSRFMKSFKSSWI